MNESDVLNESGIHGERDGGVGGGVKWFETEHSWQ